MDRDIVHPEIEAYLTALAGESPPVVAEMEQVAAERRFPIVGPLVGRLLALLSRSVGARRVFELGSGFGYSAAWFAEAVGGAGRVVMTETSEQNLRAARDFLGRAGLLDRVEMRHSEALAALAADRGNWDIIFCDIDKEAYPEVPALALPRLCSGGLLIFDNVLWHGRVPDAGLDEATEAVRELNERLFAHPDLTTTIIPIRDGVAISRRA
jgi:predicted O-methyltransferase YrrM